MGTSMNLDNGRTGARTSDIPGARAALGLNAPCESNAENTPITIKAGRGGFRANATGGLRSPPGGRPRNVPRLVMPVDVERWYCVRAVRGQERHADIAIRLAGFTLFAPTILKLATPPRRDSTGAMRPGKPDRIGYMFGAYMFVSLNLSEPGWRGIKDVEGVDRVMTGADLSARASGMPVAVPDSAIDWVRGLLEPNGCMYPKNYPGYRHRDLVAVGTAQRMLVGGMMDQIGICDWSDHRRARLLFNILGRQVPVTVDRAAFEAV